MNRNRNLSDPRVIRSRRDLCRALLELLQEKSLDDITIQEITSRAMVSKNTFYNNFRDKEELLECIFVQASDQLRQAVNPSELLRQGKTREEVFRLFLTKAVHFFYERSPILRKTFENDSSKTLYWCYLKFMNRALRLLLEKEGSANSVDSEIFVHFYSGAFANLLYFSLSNGSISEQTMVESLCNSLIRPQGLARK